MGDNKRLSRFLSRLLGCHFGGKKTGCHFSLSLLVCCLVCGKGIFSQCFVYSFVDYSRFYLLGVGVVGVVVTVAVVVVW